MHNCFLRTPHRPIQVPSFRRRSSRRRTDASSGQVAGNMDDLMICSSFKVVTQRISGAAHALGMVPSRISGASRNWRAMGVRLVSVQRAPSAVTDLGKEFNKALLNMMHGATAALEEVGARPRDAIRPNPISCPSGCSNGDRAVVLCSWRRIRSSGLRSRQRNRKVNIEENFDLSIRVRQLPARIQGWS